eukprot:12913278-Prorocentrum_lima.AAC.1
MAIPVPELRTALPSIQGDQCAHLSGQLRVGHGRQPRAGRIQRIRRAPRSSRSLGFLATRDESYMEELLQLAVG